MRLIKRIALLLTALTVVAVGFNSPRPTVAADVTETPVTPGELLIRTEEGKPGGACPLKHTDMEANISGFIARVTVVQQFHNPTDEKIEAVYVFPLPDNSAVDHMEMKVGDRTIVGEIHRREVAQEIYEAAKEAGHVASLLDQERPNIFTQSVANIMPGEQVRITISYTQLLKYETGWYEFVFPMVVGPRFMPGNPTGAGGTTEVPDASRITPPITPKGTRAGHDISIRVSINAGVQIHGTLSELHEVESEYPSQTSAVVTLKDKTTIPNKDFVLRYDVASEHVQNGMITHAPGSGGGFFTLIFQPPKTVRQKFVTPKEMIFIIDTSGSQKGEPIKKSKETLLHCIENVNPGDTFNLIAFSNSPRMLFDKARPFNAANETAALEYLKECEAHGGTQIKPALEKALPMPPDPNRLRVVVICTDGYVGNDMAILDYLQKNLGSARVFAIGMGNGVNRFLIEKMSEIGRGAPDYVFLNTDGQQAAQKFYDRIRNPLVTDIEIDWNGLPIEVDETYPKRVPDLFGSQPVIVKGRFTAPATGEVILRGKVAGEPWVRRVAVQLPARQSHNDALASLWARAKVEELMDKDWLGAQQGNPDPDIKDQITELALDYHLMTQYTSFVAVEKMVVTDGGTPRTINVPVEMPEGVSYDAIFGGEAEQLGLGRGYGSRYAGVAKGSAVAGAHLYADRTRAALPTTAPKAPATKKGLQWPEGVDQAQPSDLDSSVIVKGDEEATDDFKWSVDGDKPQVEAEMKRIRLVNARLDKTLLDLLAKYKKHGDSGSYSIPGKLVVKDARVEVMIWVKDSSDEKIAELEKLGLADRKWAVKDRILLGWIPIDKLEDLAQLEFITRVSPPIYSGES